MKINIQFLIILISLVLVTCKQTPDYNNPVDSQVTLKPPKSLTIQSFSITQVQLSWVYDVDYSGYATDGLTVEIEQSVNSGVYTVIKSVPLSQSSATVTGTYIITDNYSFRARIKVTTKTSAYSNLADCAGQSLSAVPTMVYVTGGTFQMGSTTGDPDELPVHSVTLKSFYISIYETTVKQYRDYCTAKGISMPSAPSWGWNDNDPMVNVSWNDATAYCQWLSQQTGKSVRLPTEAEWEFVARGGTKTNNYSYSGSNAIDSVAWYSTNSTNKTHQVGTKAGNELGIYDMSGNTQEWCNDWYGTYSSTAQTNPTGPTSGIYRVLRGGSWGNDVSYCRVSVRIYNYPTNFFNYVGFRFVQD